MLRMKKITDIDGIIRKLYRSGYSVAAIGRKVGRQTASVANTLARLGLRERTHPDRLTVEQRAEILAAYKSGELSGTIAKRYGFAVATIREVARKGGALIHGRGNRSAVFSETEQALMRSMWDSGESHRAIAVALGRTPPTVANFMSNRMGLTSLRHARGEKHANWTGGRRVQAGYVYVLIQKDDPFACMRTVIGYVAEHRLVMARTLGRPLTSTEQVHHINGVKSDNRPENLELHHGPHGNGGTYECCDCGSRNVRAIAIRH